MNKCQFCTLRNLVAFWTQFCSCVAEEYTFSCGGTGEG